MLNADLTSCEGVPKMLYPNEERRVLLSKALIHLGPYDNSDYLEIEYDPELKEVRVLHHGGEQLTECVYSTMLEEV